MDKEQFSEKMRGIAKAKMVRGNPPELAEGDWFWLNPIIDSDGVCWRIDYRPNLRTEWFTVKIYADGWAQRKANFWIGWNGSRTNRSRDLSIMSEQRPELYDSVMQRLLDSAEEMESKRM